MEKKYRSILKRVVLVPLIIMMVLSIAVFAVAVQVFEQTKDREIESRLAAMQSGYAQLGNIMGQCEFTFARYFSSEKSAGILRNVPAGTLEQEYFEPVVDSVRYLETLKDANALVDGILLYYPNISSLNFRSNRQKELKDLLTEQLREGASIYNQWHILTADQPYIVYIMKNGDACCGCWMAVENVLQKLGLEESDPYNGIVYFTDTLDNNSLSDPELRSLAAEGEASGSAEAEKKRYEWYPAEEIGHAVYPILLVQEKTLFEQIPLPLRIVFLVAILGFISTLALVLWLNRRISRPIMSIVNAMGRYGNGDVEYRLEERRGKTIDEFDLLGHSLNEMMDKVNELEFNLYETRLREQDIQLKYISQQIRPHFILNALNVIYTYGDDEFSQAKQMVIYLVNYFRYIVNLRKDFVRLEQEFRHVKNYLKIQKERTQNQIDYYVEWEQAVNEALIPPLIIQTFVENSIKYAVSDHILYIIVRAQKDMDKVKLTISDTGQGFSEETLQNIRYFLETREDDGSLGVGIVNAVQRMDILYQEDVELRIGNTESGGACTEIWLPLRFDTVSAE